MAKAPLKSDPHYLVSPRGTTVAVGSAVELHNLLSRGYKPQSRATLEAVVDAVVEQPAVPTGPVEPVETPDEKPVETPAKKTEAKQVRQGPADA